MKLVVIKLYFFSHSFNFLAVNIFYLICLKSNKSFSTATMLKYMRNSVNLTNTTFAHAVNSQKELSAALNDKKIDIIEADISMGKLNDEGPLLPIMAHPPLESSDLTLTDFLNQIMDYNNENMKNKKGIKLDFKTTAVFETSLNVLRYMIPWMSCPFWLNADIIVGPVNSNTVPVDPELFFAGCSQFNNSIVLSIGWTTEWDAHSSTDSYTSSEIDKMLHVIDKNHVTQNTITFPVRAGIAANSQKELEKLFQALNDTHNVSLTIWSSKNDFVDVEKLRKLIFDFGFDRIYLDVPEELFKELNLAQYWTNSLSSTVSFVSGTLMISACIVLMVGFWMRQF